MVRGIWIFLLMFKFSTMIIWNVDAERDLNDVIPLLACPKNILHQCKCGINGTLQEVYVESCHIYNSEFDFYECLPCPNACLKFSNCLSCSKNRCRTCPPEDSGDFCDSKKVNLSYEIESLKMSRKQDLNSTLSETFSSLTPFIYNNSKLANVSSLSTDSDMSKSFREISDDFISNLTDMENWFLLNTNVTFTDSDNTSSLENFVKDSSLISDILDFADLMHSWKSPQTQSELHEDLLQDSLSAASNEDLIMLQTKNKNNNSINKSEIPSLKINNIIQSESLLDGFFDQDVSLSASEDKEYYIILQPEKINNNTIKEPGVYNLSVLKPAQSEYVFDASLNQDLFASKDDNNSISMISESQHINAFEKIKNKTEPLSYKANSENVSHEKILSKNVNSSFDKIENDIDNALYNNSDFSIGKNDHPIIAYKKEKIGTNNSREREILLDKNRNLTPSMLGDDQGFRSQKAKKVDSTSDMINQDSGQYSLESFALLPNDFVYPKELHQKISPFLSEAKELKKAFHLEELIDESEPRKILSYQDNNAHNNMLINVSTKYDIKQEVLSNEVLQGRLSSNTQEVASIPDVKSSQEKLFISKQRNTNFKNKLPEIFFSRNIRNYYEQEDALKNNKSRNNIPNNELMQNGINNNARNKISMQDKPTVNTHDNTSNKLSTVSLSKKNLNYNIQQEALQEENLHNNIPGNISLQDWLYRTSMGKVLLQDKLFTNNYDEDKSSEAFLMHSIPKIQKKVVQDYSHGKAEDNALKKTKIFSNTNDHISKKDELTNLFRDFDDASNQNLTLGRSKNLTITKNGSRNPFSSLFPNFESYSAHCKMHFFDPMCYSWRVLFFINRFLSSTHFKENLKKTESQSVGGINEELITSVLKGMPREKIGSLIYFLLNSLKEKRENESQLDNFDSYDDDLQRNEPITSNQQVVPPKNYPYTSLDAYYDEEINKNHVTNKRYEESSSVVDYKDIIEPDFKNFRRSNFILNIKFNDENSQYDGMHNLKVLVDKNNIYKNYEELSTINSSENNSLTSLKNHISNHDASSKSLNKLRSQYPDKHHINNDKYSEIVHIKLPKSEKTEYHYAEPLKEKKVLPPRQFQDNSEENKSEGKNNLENSNSAKYSFHAHIAPKKTKVENLSKFEIFKTVIPSKTQSKVTDSRSSSLNIINKMQQKSSYNEENKTRNLSLGLKNSDETKRRRRRESDDSWCQIIRQSLHGDLECMMWPHKKVCWLECHEGYEPSETSFICFREINQWFPPISPCIGAEENNTQSFEDSSFDNHNSLEDIVMKDGSTRNDTETRDNQYEIVYYDDHEEDYKSAPFNIQT